MKTEEYAALRGFITIEAAAIVPKLYSVARLAAAAFLFEKYVVTELVLRDLENAA